VCSSRMKADECLRSRFVGESNRCVGLYTVHCVQCTVYSRTHERREVKGESEKRQKASQTVPYWLEGGRSVVQNETFHLEVFITQYRR
jgi:hypothetical protein